MASRISLRNSGKKSPQTFRAELFQGGILRFEDAIRSEKNNVTRLQVDGRLIVLGIGNEAERHAFQVNRPHLTIADQEGIRSASVGEREFPSRCVVNCEQHGDESRIKPRAEQPLIQKSEHASRPASPEYQDCRHSGPSGECFYTSIPPL